MAKKQEKEVEKWVTINGARVPIFKDGSIGGPKALRDKLKNMDSFEKSQKGLYTNTSNAKEQVDMLKAELKKHSNDIHTNEIKARLKKAEDRYKKLKKGEDPDKDVFKTKKEWDQIEKKAKVTKVGETSGGSFNIKEMNKKLEAEKKAKAKKEAELSKKASKLKPTPESTKLANEEAQKTKDNYVKEYGVTGARNAEQLREKIKSNGWKIDSADMSDIEHKHLESGDKVTVWDSKGKEYEATYNRYKDGGVELVSVKAKQTKEQKNISKNDDLKEKQMEKAKMEKLTAEGMSEKEARIYLDNERKMKEMRRELEEEMSSSGEGNHSVNWRRDQQDKISKLSEENWNIKAGKYRKEDNKKAGVSGDTSRQKAKQEALVLHESLMGETYKQAKSNLASMGKGELATIARKLGIPSRFIKDMDADKLRDRLLFIYKGSHK